MVVILRRAKGLLQAGVVTINEVRDETGLPTIP
jgi:hypothetical protein